MKSHMRVRALCEGAVLVAVAQILSYLKLWEMPWGGSVVLSMIPLVLYAVRWGLGAGLLGGFAFGVLQFMFDGGFAIGWQSIVGDYLVAFTVLGLAGLVARRKSGVFTGTLIAGFSRFLVHYVVGATVWAEYMPETFFGMTMHSPWFYSLLLQSGVHAPQHRYHPFGLCRGVQAPEEVLYRTRPASSARCGPAGQGSHLSQMGS